MRPFFAGLGYLRHDRRGERRGGVDERDTTHCCHCQALILLTTTVEGTLTKKSYRGSWCAPCGALKCERRGCQPCSPFMRQVEAKHARDRQAAAIGLVTR
jgi:hypothetical protein